MQQLESVESVDIPPLPNLQSQDASGSGHHAGAREHTYLTFILFGVPPRNSDLLHRDVFDVLVVCHRTQSIEQGSFQVLDVVRLEQYTLFDSPTYGRPCGFLLYIICQYCHCICIFSKLIEGVASQTHNLPFCSRCYSCVCFFVVVDRLRDCLD